MGYSRRDHNLKKSSSFTPEVDVAIRLLPLNGLDKITEAGCTSSLAQEMDRRAGRCSNSSLDDKQHSSHDSIRLSQYFGSTLINGYPPCQQPQSRPRAAKNLCDSSWHGEMRV